MARKWGSTGGEWSSSWTAPSGGGPRLRSRPAPANRSRGATREPTGRSAAWPTVCLSSRAVSRIGLGLVRSTTACSSRGRRRIPECGDRGPARPSGTSLDTRPSSVPTAPLYRSRKASAAGSLIQTEHPWISRYRRSDMDPHSEDRRPRGLSKAGEQARRESESLRHLVGIRDRHTAGRRELVRREIPGVHGPDRLETQHIRVLGGRSAVLDAARNQHALSLLHVSLVSG